MERYDGDWEHGSMQPATDGDWVKYDDVKEIINRQICKADVWLNDLSARIPCTKDGKPILWGDTVFIANPDGAPYEDGYVLPIKVESIMIGCHFEEYDGTHTIMGGDNECGNLECYSASEFVPDQY